MSPRLIVLEKTGRWAAALRCAGGRRELPIREVRSFEQAEREFAEQPATMAAIEVSPVSAIKVASHLAAWRKRFPDARFVALADPELAPLEPALRDAGAVHVVYATRDLAATVRLIRRHLARIPRPAMTLEESIFERLPWGATTTP